MIAIVALGALLAAAPELPKGPLPTSRGGTVDLAEQIRRGPWTVISFFSAGCPVQESHDERLIETWKTFHGRSVQFFAIDSEAAATPATDAQEARSRGYPFPILTDSDGAWAKALGARFSTFSVVIDPQGQVRYRGGLDSDHMRMKPDAKRYLDDALTALLAGREPPANDTKAMGCLLRTR